MGLVAAGMLGFTFLLAPALEPFRSTRSLGMRLDAVLAPGQDFLFYRRLQDSVVFYTRRQGVVLRGNKALAPHLASEERVFCVIERRHLKKIVGLKDHFHVVAVEGDRYVISNREEPLAP